MIADHGRIDPQRVAIGLTVIEINSFWGAGLSGVEGHRMFPPFYSHHYDIGDTRTLTTGCDHIDDEDYFIYELTLPGGEEFDLGMKARAPQRRFAALPQSFRSRV